MKGNFELSKCKEVEFKDIKIGEVFGYEGCFIVAVKTNDKSAKILAGDLIFDDVIPYVTPMRIHYFSGTSDVYRLPLRYQELWLPGVSK